METKPYEKTKEYMRPMPPTWWLHNRYLVLFMVRELTSVFVAGYAVFLLILLAFSRDLDSFRSFFSHVLESPVAIALQLFALVFVVLHSVTSFNAAPQIMVIQRGEERVSPGLIAAANYGLWAAVSVAVLIFVLS